LLVFTLFICLGAGTLGVAGLLAGLGKAKEVQLPAAAVSLVAIAAGGVASFLHLEHWDRIFNGFGHLASGITQELIGIAVFAAVAASCLVLARRGTVPRWAGWCALVVSVALVVVMSLSYTMAARPVWNTPLLPLYYLANALLFGSLAVALIAAVRKAPCKLITVLALVGGTLTLVVALSYGIFIPSAASAFTSVGNYFDPTQPTKATADPQGVLAGFLTGEYALLFWGGVVALGAAFPLVASLFARGKEGTIHLASVALGCACALAGGLCFRVVFYVLGFSVFVFY
jgi:anaerobic dimethyl sulfoxide reductase subunit C (anchor subunit)